MNVDAGNNRTSKFDLTQWLEAVQFLYLQLISKSPFMWAYYDNELDHIPGSSCLVDTKLEMYPYL